jgi:hypothetical protein
MSWALVFLIYTAQGAVHQDILHGYGSKGDCQLEARVFERRFDLIKWECVRDVLAVTATQRRDSRESGGHWAKSQN